MTPALLLLLAAVQAAPAPPPAVRIAELKADCLAGVGGDAAAAGRCSAFLTAQAAALAPADDGTSTCLGSSRGPASELTWNWLDWIEANPAPDDADAGASVGASILGRWPCGWREG